MKLITLKNKLVIASFVLWTSMLSCTKNTILVDGDNDGAVDMTKPTINFKVANGFPKPCEVLKAGDKFLLRVELQDNQELGSYSVDIHHNFDHHSHSTEVISCALDPKKSADNPFVHIKSYAIPGSTKKYLVEQEISIPASIDKGDYHFMLKVTDKSGWQQIEGFSIKIN